jgi:hypothetical protein
LPDFFGFCPTTPEKIFVEQINFGDLPPQIFPELKEANIARL